MIPKMIKRYQAKNGQEVCFFNTGVISTGFRLKHIDRENVDLEDLTKKMESFCDNLPDEIVVKFTSKTDRSFDEIAPETKRGEAISYLGRTEHNLSIVFEKSVPNIKNQIFSLFNKKMISGYMDEYFESFLSQINISSLETLGLKPVPIVLEERLQSSYIKKLDGCLRVDESFLSVIKLKKLGNYENGIESITYLRESFPEPFEIIFTIKKVDEKNAQILLNNKSKREESGQDLKSHKKYLEAQKALEEIDNQGKKVFLIEFTVLLWFFDLRSVHSFSYEIKNELSKVAEFVVEDMGLLPGFVSSLPGGKPHVTNIEMTDRIPTFFPILINGKEDLPKTVSRSFLFHRRDDTVDAMDVFTSEQCNYSGIIVGRSGRGKSVFTNNLIQSLDNDPKLKIILVDVKGSHTNTVKNLGGKVFPINTSIQSAISPFNFLRQNKSMEIIEILADFLEKLLLEDHETALLRQEQAVLEEALVKYASLNPSNPSIDDFAKKIKSIPRADALKRWLKGGVYGSIFADYNEHSDSKIQYFDFTNIVTAQKGGVSSAIMSAVMAHFNYILMSKETDERLVFIADETPFFIRGCFSSFSLLMKNVRKLNGSLILIAQNLDDLIVDGNDSLVTQTEFRIFFGHEGTEKFEIMCGLNNESVLKLKDFRTFNGRFAQFIIKTGEREMEGRLKLSKSEYFRSTTLSEDREKIEALTNLFKFKDENIAIEILADIGGRYADYV